MFTSTVLFCAFPCQHSLVLFILFRHLVSSFPLPQFFLVLVNSFLPIAASAIRNPLYTCTQGITIWGKPILNRFHEPKSEEQYLMLLDTQGTGVGNETVNIHLSALSYFLSSSVVFQLVNRFPKVFVCGFFDCFVSSVCAMFACVDFFVFGTARIMMRSLLLSLQVKMCKMTLNMYKPFMRFKIV